MIDSVGECPKRVDVAYIALGSNLGDRSRHLGDARTRIAAIPDLLIQSVSRIEETDPIGPPGQGAYLNQMLAVRTTLSPPELLVRLHAIEDAGGRERHIRWGARTIDLDIVCYANTAWHDTDLVVPHPELPNRVFWQRELDELLSNVAGGHGSTNLGCDNPYLIR
jgi:2-amino-4-hydroxy-6-hydroxymethyldihydropteridine diphosphokinase